MIFLNINILIAIIYLILHILSTIDLSYKFKRKYPDLKVPKTNWASKILSAIRTIIIALIPVFNLALCLVFIFRYEELENKTIKNVYIKCISKENQDVQMGH